MLMLMIDIGCSTMSHRSTPVRSLVNNAEYLGVIALERLQLNDLDKNVVPHEIFLQPGAIYFLIKSYLCKQSPSTIFSAQTNTSLSQQSSAGP